MAVGCSAETGDQGPEAQIGSTAEALTFNATKDALPAARDNAASCVIQDGTGKSYLLVTGGSDTAGTTVYSDAYLFDRTASATHQYTSFTSKLTTARKNHAMIQVPGDATKCLVAGGLDGSDVGISDTRVLTLTKPGGVLTLTESSAITGLTARGKLKMDYCGTSHVVSVGGVDSGSPADAIEVWSSGNNWVAVKQPGSSSAATLTTARKDFGFAVAQDGNKKNFLVAGGRGPGGALSSIETLQFSQSNNGFECDTVDVDQFTSKLGVSGGSNYARDLNPATFDVSTSAGTSHFIVAGGDDGTNALQTSDKVPVTWAATPTIGTVTNDSTLITQAVQSPTLVLANGLPVLIGGANHAGSTAYTTVQKYVSGAWTAATTNLPSARVRMTAQWIPPTSGGVDFIEAAGGYDGSVAQDETYEVTAP
jgi:hypothetical protein